MMSSTSTLFLTISIITAGYWIADAIDRLTKAINQAVVAWRINQR